MGIIFGLINIMVAVWFYSSARSVKKPAITWAIIGALSYFAFKFLGYSLLGMVLEIENQGFLDSLINQGYTLSERSTSALSVESTLNDQSTVVGIFYEFFPLIVALLGVSFIRAKFILGMGYVESLKHKSSLSFGSDEREHDS